MESGANEKAVDLSLKEAVQYLEKVNASYEDHEFLGNHVLRILPSSGRNLPRWLKMAAEMDKKYGIPTHLDPVILKQSGHEGSTLQFIETEDRIIALDPSFAIKNPENTKILMAHEAVHSTGGVKAATGKAGPDNGLQMSFRSEAFTLHSQLPGSYAHYFSVDEVKAYAKQGKILNTMIRQKAAKLDLTDFLQMGDNAALAQRYTLAFAKASQELFDQTEAFLKASAGHENPAITVKQRTGIWENIFDVTVKVSSNGEDPFYFEISIYDSVAAQTGHIKDINQKLVQIIEAARKTVQYYERISR
jgi:hypothetical protein